MTHRTYPHSMVNRHWLNIQRAHVRAGTAWMISTFGHADRQALFNEQAATFKALMVAQHYLLAEAGHFLIHRSPVIS